MRHVGALGDGSSSAGFRPRKISSSNTTNPSCCGPRPAAEFIIHIPSIADVSVRSGKLLVVTGKSFGITNMLGSNCTSKGVVTVQSGTDFGGITQANCTSNGVVFSDSAAASGSADDGRHVHWRRRAQQRSS